MAKIIVTPYSAGTVDHATKNEQQRLRLIHIWLVRSTMSRRMKWQDYSCSILGWYSEPHDKPYHDKLNSEDYTDTIYSFITCSGHHQQYRLRIVHLARKTPRYTIKKYTCGHHL